MRASTTALLACAILLGGEAGEVRAAGGPAPAEILTGRGAAGVTEVGRPLDVVRGKAEREARNRAIADLLLAVGSVRTKQGGPTDAEIEARVRKAAEDPSRWDMGYWTSGAVTARLTVPVGEFLAGDRAVVK